METFFNKIKINNKIIIYNKKKPWKKIEIIKNSNKNQSGFIIKYIAQDIDGFNEFTILEKQCDFYPINKKEFEWLTC